VSNPAVGIRKHFNSFHQVFHYPLKKENRTEASRSGRLAILRMADITHAPADVFLEYCPTTY
jgi:hypothetical protein